MNTERNNTNDRKQNGNVKDDATSQPDGDTLHTTDPQENMEGPLSSLMHDTGEQFDTQETRQKADAEKEKGM